MYMIRDVVKHGPSANSFSHIIVSNAAGRFRLARNMHAKVREISRAGSENFKISGFVNVIRHDGRDEGMLAAARDQNNRRILFVNRTSSEEIQVLRYEWLVLISSKWLSLSC